MKRFLFIAILVICLFLIQSLVRSIYSLWQKHDLLLKAGQELTLEKQENKRIKEQLALAKESSFIEQEARNKLFLTKTGESSVIIDEKAINAALKKEDQKKEEKPNWKQWWELFF